MEPFFLTSNGFTVPLSQNSPFVLAHSSSDVVVHFACRAGISLFCFSQPVCLDTQDERRTRLVWSLVTSYYVNLELTTWSFVSAPLYTTGAKSRRRKKHETRSFWQVDRLIMAFRRPKRGQLERSERWLIFSNGQLLLLQSVNGRISHAFHAATSHPIASLDLLHSTQKQKRKWIQMSASIPSVGSKTLCGHTVPTQSIISFSLFPLFRLIWYFFLFFSRHVDPKQREIGRQSNHVVSWYLVLFFV